MRLFASPSFRWLWCSTLATSIGTGMHTTATGWLALDSAGGAFAVGLVLAARMLPNLLFGLAAGTLADRGRRNRVLVAVGLIGVPVMLALGQLAQRGSVAVWQLGALAFVTGCLNVLDIPARQALVMDTVPREIAPNAMGVNALASRLCIAMGGFVAGAVIPSAGVPACYAAVAVAYALSAGLVVFARPVTGKPAHLGSRRPAFTKALGQAGRLILDLPAVRILVLAGVACEVFGFSYQTAVPTFTRDVLAAGPEGLGTLNAAAALGGSLAVVLLASIPARVAREPLLGVVFVSYGASLLALGAARDLPAAAAILVVTGASAAGFDLLQQTLIQFAVPEEHRGRAIGVWVLGIGSAPVGHLEMGALAAGVGVPTALAINGALVLVAAATLLVRAPRYRWLLA